MVIANTGFAPRRTGSEHRYINRLTCRPLLLPGQTPSLAAVPHIFYTIFSKKSNNGLFLCSGNAKVLFTEGIDRWHGDPDGAFRRSL